MTPRRNVPVVTTTARQTSARPSARVDPGGGAGIAENARGFAFDDRQVRRFHYERLHRAPIETPIGLSARALYGGTLAAIEDAELNPRPIRRPRHQTIEGVNLANEVALAEPANCRVARHFADRGETLCDQRRRGAATGRGGSRLRPGMPTADDDDVKLSESPVSRETHLTKSLSDTQPRKNLSEHVFDADSPGDPVHSGGCAAQILGDQFWFRRFQREHRR